MVVVARCSPDVTELREQFTHLRKNPVKERHFCCVLTTGTVVSIERLAPVVVRVLRVPTNTLAPGAELGDPRALLLQPAGRIGQGATSRQAGSPTRSGRTTQRVHVRMPAKVLNILSRENMLIVGKACRNRIRSACARSTNAATCSELGNIDLIELPIILTDEPRNRIPHFDKALIVNRVNNELHRLRSNLLQLIPELLNGINALLKGVRNSFLDEIVHGLEHVVLHPIPNITQIIPEIRHPITNSVHKKLERIRNSHLHKTVNRHKHLQPHKRPRQLKNPLPTIHAGTDQIHERLKGVRNCFHYEILYGRENVSLHKSPHSGEN